jgi:AcrR family transcriptional regulator
MSDIMKWECETMEFSPAEERIIQATIDCIEQYGIEHTTIRKIAEQSGMNSAAISYYFRSKDILIEKALEATLHYAFRWSDFEATEAMDLESQLIDIFSYLTVRAQEFPKLTRAHFHDVFQMKPSQTPIETHLNRFMDKLYEEAIRKQPQADAVKLKRALILIISSTMLYSSMFRPVFESFEPNTGAKTDDLKDYVRQVVVSALSQITQ